mmetsp:Transcript_8911/g.26177  ORF Transcript_8911/g.26177 Transcript_8911/m.26177 type:complete len:293 (-) Transcript_8911:39-917(-)
MRTVCLLLLGRASVALGVVASRSRWNSTGGKWDPKIYASPSTSTPRPRIGPPPCPLLVPMAHFNLTAYSSRPWYPQLQMPLAWQPVEDLKCMSTSYSKLNKCRDDRYAGFANLKCLPKTWPMGFGWELDFSNKADTNRHGGDTSGFLCASQVKGSMLKVAPCFVPSTFAGPYWVVFYNEGWKEPIGPGNRNGVAIVASGQPDKVITTLPKTSKDDPKAENKVRCMYHDIKNRGLWIMTRQRKYDPNIVQHAMNIAQDFGFETSIMHKVDQTGCDRTTTTATATTTTETTTTP